MLAEIVTHLNGSKSGFLLDLPRSFSAERTGAKPVITHPWMVFRTEQHEVRNETPEVGPGKNQLRWPPEVTQRPL